MEKVGSHDRPKHICVQPSLCDAQFHNRKGNDCFGNKDYNKAIEYYSEGLKVDANNAVLYSNRRSVFPASGLLFRFIDIVVQFATHQCVLCCVEAVAKGV